MRTDGGGRRDTGGGKMADSVLSFDACVIYSEDTGVPAQDRERSGGKERARAAT